MQIEDLETIYQFILNQAANFIEFCKERGQSECEADRIIDELEELSR